MNQKVTIGKFVEKLASCGGSVPLHVDYPEQAYQSGWLEAQDVLGKEQAVQRKTAARIIHEFLRREMKEADEVDGSPAYRLQDLFDCRVCAGHIIQVYVKGIMDGKESPDGRVIFGTEAVLSLEETEEILCRIFDKSRRKMRNVAAQEAEIKENSEKGFLLSEAELSVEQAMQMVQEEKQALLIDVRTQRDFEQEHRKGAVNVPWVQLLKNPYMVSERRDVPILLYCAEGYQSRAAAQMLLEAGYEKVFYFAWNA